MVAIIMSTIRVREKRQITIPNDIGIKAGIEPNDILEVEITTGGILLRPIRSLTQSRVNKLMKFAGVGQVLTNPIDPDENVKLLREDRDAWTH